MEVGTLSFSSLSIHEGRNIASDQVDSKLHILVSLISTAAGQKSTAEVLIGKFHFSDVAGSALQWDWAAGQCVGEGREGAIL